MVTARTAVSSPFFISGVIIGGWAPMVPVIKHNLQITESDIGLMIFIGGIFSVMIMGCSSWLISQFGSDRVTKYAAYLFLPSLLMLVLAPNFLFACMAAIWLFSTVAVMDIAMNANGVEVENKLGKPIMSSLHGFWSLGAMLGAALGGVFLAQFGELALAISVLCFGAVVYFFTLGSLQKPSGHTVEETGPDQSKLQGFPPRNITIYLIGLLAFISFTAEGAILDWGALFLREDIGATIAISGLGFASFSLAMTIARFSGDWAKAKLGAKLLMQLSATIAGAGLLIVGIADFLPLTMFGFFLTGLGNANIVPVAFSAAEQVPGMKRGVGISTATFCGYIGLLLAPATLGYVAEHLGFRPIYLAFAISMVLVFAVSVLLRERHTATSSKTS